MNLIFGSQSKMTITNTLKSKPNGVCAIHKPGMREAGDMITSL